MKPQNQISIPYAHKSHWYVTFFISYLSQNASTKKISKRIPVNVPIAS